MAALTESQTKRLYFGIVGGFPGSRVIHALSEYDGGEQLCVACTQLNGREVNTLYPNAEAYSERDKRRIPKEWVRFFRANTSALRRLHFNSRVSQALFDAACRQANLEELRFKFGPYSDLSALENLGKLKRLYIGQGSNVQGIETLGKLKGLTVLHLEAFKKIDDYSPLSALKELEQLVITGSITGATPIRDLAFLRDMPNLRSISLSNVKIARRYTPEELSDLRDSLPNLYDIQHCLH